MSRVYFHSAEGTAELAGMERAHASVLTGNIAVAMFDSIIETYGNEQPLKRVLPPQHYLQLAGPVEFGRQFETWLRVGIGTDAYFILGDQRVPAWDVVLNTAVVIGGDELKWLARMHAQCEIHGYVEGEDRAWLAGIMEQGLANKLYRQKMGWESVIELLKSRDNSPVVMSYSVCEQFPNANVGDWFKDVGDSDEDHDKRSDEWYELPTDEKWRMSLEGLRAHPGKLRIRRDNFGEYGYGLALSAFDVIDFLNHDRTTAATK